MPTRSGHPYLLGDSSKPHTFPINHQQIAAMFAEINTKLEALKTFDEGWLK